MRCKSAHQVVKPAVHYQHTVGLDIHCKAVYLRMHVLRYSWLVDATAAL